MKWLRLLLLTGVSVFVISCTEPAATPHRITLGHDTAARFAEAPQDRPGLGTRWGETRGSQVHAADFRRAGRLHPTSRVSIFYNNAAGIHAMADAGSLRRSWLEFPSETPSLAAVGLRDESGRMLPQLDIDGEQFVVGKEGRRYSIVVRNRSRVHLAAVLSVDGLDVVDGEKASVAKRGYIIEPHRQLTVEGFRQSTESVAAFRFGPVRESYAQEKHRDTRNVGVIGIALFGEAGAESVAAR